MPHLKRNLHVAARRVSITVALLCISGCSSDAGNAGDSSSKGEVVVLLASSHPAGTTVVASSADPALDDSAPSQDGRAATAVPADSAALYLALTDSAVRLDGTFQRERTALNREALAMRSMDRTSADYHSRYQALDRRAAAAEAVRAARDRARTHAMALSRRYPSVREQPRRGEPPRVVRATADSGTVKLVLDPGDWWVSLASSRKVSRVRVRVGSRDTVRLR